MVRLFLRVESYVKHTKTKKLMKKIVITSYAEIEKT